MHPHAFSPQKVYSPPQFLECFCRMYDPAHVVISWLRNGRAKVRARLVSSSITVATAYALGRLSCAHDYQYCLHDQAGLHHGSRVAAASCSPEAGSAAENSEDDENSPTPSVKSGLAADTSVFAGSTDASAESGSGTTEVILPCFVALRTVSTARRSASETSTVIGACIRRATSVAAVNPIAARDSHNACNRPCS